MAEMIPTNKFKNGHKIELDGQPYEILSHEHHKPGKGGAVMRTKLRNLLTGRVVDHTFRSGEKVAKPDMETRVMQFLYREASRYIFMDMTSYEQLEVAGDTLGNRGEFLVDGSEIKVLLYNGSPLDVDLPASVIMEVTQTDPGVKGDTVSGATKPATLSSGLVVTVPLFINPGDSIKIDTRSGEYIGREK